MCPDNSDRVEFSGLGHTTRATLPCTMWKSEDIAKWVGIVSGVITLLLAVPAVLGFGMWIRATLALAMLGVAYALFIYLRSTPYDIEFVDHRVELDIQDRAALRVLQTRRTRLKALRNGVETVTDHMSADGGLSIPTVNPGTVKQITREGGDLYVCSTLGHVLHKGEEIEREMTTALENSFPDTDAEYWNVRIHHPTQRFTLIVKFRPDRPPKNYRGMQRVSTYEKLTIVQPQLSHSGDRPILTWTILHPSLRDLYRLDWNW